MDKLPFDHIENRIRQAAESVSPPFNEKAWDKMEVLLDKELKSRRRRRFIAWWPFLLLLAGGTGIYFYYSSKLASKKHPLVTQRATIKPPVENRDVKKNISGLRGTNNQRTEALKSASSAGKQIPVKGNVLSSSTRPDSTRFLGKEGTRKGNSRFLYGFNNERKFTKRNKKGAFNPPPVRATNAIPKAPDINRNVVEGNTTANPLQINKAPTSEPELDSTVALAGIVPGLGDSAKDDINTIQTAKEKIKLTPVDKTSGFYFGVTVSPDASAIRRFDLNKNVSLIYGIMVGYQLNNRVSFQTGIYGARKNYKAGPGDYHAKAGSYLDTVNMLRINASCIMFDVPVSMRYVLVKNKNFNIYTVAGISSFIMKKEVYDYHYKYYYNGQYNQIEKTYRGNKNFFSVANLSVGFEKKVSGAFYLLAEPYVKVPLSGVGEGKIKLYSTGIQVGVRYQPIKKKDKR